MAIFASIPIGIRCGAIRASTRSSPRSRRTTPKRFRNVPRNLSPELLHYPVTVSNKTKKRKVTNRCKSKLTITPNSSPHWPSRWSWPASRPGVGQREGGRASIDCRSLEMRSLLPRLDPDIRDLRPMAQRWSGIRSQFHRPGRSLPGNLQNDGQWDRPALPRHLHV